MSVGQPPGTPPTPAAVAAVPASPTSPPREVTVISHSNLFYWWPVWAVAFLMAILTAFENNYMVTVPPHTEPREDLLVPPKERGGKAEKREGYAFPEPKDPKKSLLPRIKTGDKQGSLIDPYVHMSRSKNYGVIFCVTLLLVIVITNVPLRGMWSVIVIITVILMSIIFALADWWERIFEVFGRLDIRINMGGYLFIGLTLFVIWLITLMFFDRQVYIVFTPGQFKVCTEIGGGEKAYDSTGLSLERQKGDLFRHYILGLGSGDLVVKTSGAQAHHFDLPNVLFISKKVQQIEDLLRMRSVRETK